MDNPSSDGLFLAAMRDAPDLDSTNDIPHPDKGKISLSEQMKSDLLIIVQNRFRKAVEAESQLFQAKLMTEYEKDISLLHTEICKVREDHVCNERNGLTVPGAQARVVDANALDRAKVADLGAFGPLTVADLDMFDQANVLDLDSFDQGGVVDLDKLVKIDHTILDKANLASSESPHSEISQLHSEVGFDVSPTSANVAPQPDDLAPNASLSRNSETDQSIVSGGHAEEPRHHDHKASVAHHMKDVKERLSFRERTKLLYGAPAGTKGGFRDSLRGSSLKLRTLSYLGWPSGKEEWTCLQRLVFSSLFEVISGSVIMANTLVIALQLQYTGFDSGVSLQWPNSEPAVGVWPGAEDAFFVCNVLFNCLFAMELVFRVGANRWRSIRSGWIWFDAVVVTVGVIDVFAQDALAFNPGMMRVLRLVRLVRLLKVFQAMSSFDSLFLLLKAIFASWQALVWSFIILGLCQLIVGLFLCQLMQDFFIDDTIDIEKRLRVYKYFGTFSRTMLTMFEITLANWVPSCRVLIEDVNEVFTLFYIVYRCMFCFAILKVIAAVFITETNRVLENDDELTLMKRNREKNMFKNKLTKTFNALDQTHQGKFGWKQFDELMNDDGLSALVTTLGFEKHDFEKLFWLLDDGSGEISIHEFVNKMSKLKGQSKTIDMLTMLKLTHRIDQKIQHIFEKQGLLERNELEMAEEELACRL